MAVDLAEVGVGQASDHRPGGVRRERRAANVVGADEVHHPAFDHRHRIPAQPDIFPDRRSNGLVLLGDPAAERVEDGGDNDRSARDW